MPVTMEAGNGRQIWQYLKGKCVCTSAGPSLWIATHQVGHNNTFYFICLKNTVELCYREPSVDPAICPLYSNAVKKKHFLAYDM